MREVGLETAPYRLTPEDTDDFADYGLFNISRDATPASWVGGREPNAQNVRTTIHRSPTPTSSDNHFQDPNYFGHTRAFEADGIPHVVEIQSDLAQKAGRELGQEDRLRLERGNAALDTQQKIISDLQKSKNFSDMADSIERSLPALEAANEDFKLVFGNRLKEYPTFRISGLDEADAVDLAVRMLRNELGEQNRLGAADAMSRALGRFSDDLNVRMAENNAKLAERGEAAAQRPMFKNWERRLIREELSRAAADGKPVVRFADADTVAKVEGWQEVNVAERDRLRYAVEAQQRTVAEEERLVEAAKARGADEDTVIRRESSMGYARNKLAELRTELQRAGGDSTGRFLKEHQGIYDRYNKEVANYLKSLGGKQVTDQYGAGWWEVPVKPQQRRTQIFSMGGGTVAAGGAAAYNAATPVEED